MALWIVLLLLIASPARAASPCRGHGGVARCHASEVICKDGTLDKRFTCSSLPSRWRKSKRVLKFKHNPTARGQITEPGTPPPVSTLEESERQLK